MKRTNIQNFPCVFPIAKRSRGLLTLFLLLSVLLVVTIPFAITLFWLIRRSKVVLYEDRLVVRWMETCELVYGNIESLRWEGKNVVGTLVSTDSKDEPPSLSKLFDVSEEKVGGQFFRKRFEYKLRDQEEWRELALRNYESPSVILGALIEGANLHLVEPEAS